MSKLIKKLTIFAFLMWCAGQVAAQVEYGKIFSEADLKHIRTYEDSVDVLSGMLLHDTSSVSRFVACKYMIKGLVKALKVDNSFQYDFPQFERISIQYAPDSSFRIFTWQLFVNPDDYRYYGAIQLNSKELKLIPLADRSADMLDPANSFSTNSEWYGAIYYNIKQVDSEAFGRYYVLFGYDAHNFFTHRKILDVMQIKGNEANFGLPVFVVPPDILEEKKKIAEFNANVPVGNRIKVDDAALLAKKGENKVFNRWVVTYSAEASAILNYDEDYQLILMDNLINTGGNYKGQGEIKVPDGSYRGFQLQADGRWLQIEKVFNDFQEEAPRPVPLNRSSRLNSN